MPEVATASGRFAHRLWPDGAALFDRNTGDTHALDPFSFAVLEAAGTAGLDMDALAAMLHASFPDLPDDDLRVEISRIVADMAELGILPKSTK